MKMMMKVKDVPSYQSFLVPQVHHLCQSLCESLSVSSPIPEYLIQTPIPPSYNLNLIQTPIPPSYNLNLIQTPIPPSYKLSLQSMNTYKKVSFMEDPISYRKLT